MDDPLKTPNKVSKLLPSVSMVTIPEAGACQSHQRDLPPGLPARIGSPGSLVALMLEALTLRLEAVGGRSGSRVTNPNPCGAPCGAEGESDCALVNASLDESATRPLGQLTRTRQSSKPRLM